MSAWLVIYVVIFVRMPEFVEWGWGEDESKGVSCKHPKLGVHQLPACYPWAAGPVCPTDGW